MFLTFNLSTVILELWVMHETLQKTLCKMRCTKVKHFQLVHVYIESQWKKSSEMQKKPQKHDTQGRRTKEEKKQGLQVFFLKV